jgi:hypothetical protein
MWRSHLLRAHCLHYYDHAVSSQGALHAAAMTITITTVAGCTASSIANCCDAATTLQAVCADKRLHTESATAFVPCFILCITLVVMTPFNDPACYGGCFNKCAHFTHCCSQCSLLRVTNSRMCLHHVAPICRHSEGGQAMLQRAF